MNSKVILYFLAAGMLFCIILSISLYVSKQRLADKYSEVEEERGKLLYEKMMFAEKTGLRLAELAEFEQRVRNILEGKGGMPQEKETADSTAAAVDFNGSLNLRPSMFTLPVIWPLEKGWVTRAYQPERKHMGVDIATMEGADVFSTGNGIVKKVYEDEILGKTVEISHWGGMETLYAHNSKILVEADEAVSAGQVIAYAGSTGKSSAPHLHFEVRIDGKPIDPSIHLDRED